jgi:hypothetical protein
MNRLAPRLGSGFEVLEDRSVPTAFGIPWADPGHLTLSFTPDATSTPIGPSNLSKTLGAAGTTAAWEREVLRAFQSWAAVANIDVGLVADGGQPLGTSGAVQGDARFGDVRVAAAPLSVGEVADAAPFTWTGTTFAGDVTFDSTRAFSIGNKPSAFDVYSVAVHEAGHALGLAHSTATDSVMQENYAYRTGLGASDVAAIRALYGARTPDTFDAATAGGNDAMSRASTIPQTSAGNGQLLATASLTTATDVDYYKFTTTPVLSIGGIVVRLKASGISLLTPSVTVYNSYGQVVASAASTDPLNNDLQINFSSLLGGTFYVKVAAARSDVFGVGGYKLAVDFLTLGGVLAPITNTVGAVLDGNTNNTLATALGLNPPSSTDARFDATYRGSIENSTDIDNYKVHTDKFAAGTPVVLDVIAWGTDSTPLSPRVRVFDAAGNPVAIQVLANSTGLFSVQVPGAVAGQSYYVQVAALNPGATGAYFVGADFNQQAPTVFDGVADGTVSSSAGDSGTLAVADAGVFHFALAPDAGGVTMTVTDAAGRTVLSLTAAAGQPPVTATAYLAAGTYTVRYARTGTAAALYNLFLIKLSDGVGPYGSGASGTDPNGTTATSDSGSTYTASSSGMTMTKSYGYTY